MMQSLRGPAQATHAQPIHPRQALTLWSQTGRGLSAEVQWTLNDVPQGVQALMWLEVGDAAAGKPVQTVEIGFDADSQVLHVDRSLSGFVPPGDERYAGRRSCRCRAPSAGRPLRIRIWWDWSSVEILADEGRVSLTELILPQGSRQGLSVGARGGDYRMGETFVWPLRAARIGIGSESPPG